MRIKATALLATLSAVLAGGQTQPNPNHLRTVFVGGIRPNALLIPQYGGGVVGGSAGSSPFDVNMYFRKRCKVAVTAPGPVGADFILTLNYKQWDLMDPSGKVIFTTKAFREVNVAKDVCNFLKANP